METKRSRASSSVEPKSSGTSPMRMNEIDFEGPPPIDGYGPGGFRVAGKWFDGGLIVAPSGMSSLSGLSVEALQPLAEEAVDLILIGTGPEIAPLDREIRTTLEEGGLGVEIMATPSACRTYNVLLTEGRRVAVVLLPV